MGSGTSADLQHRFPLSFTTFQWRRRHVPLAANTFSLPGGTFETLEVASSSRDGAHGGDEVLP